MLSVSHQVNYMSFGLSLAFVPSPSVSSMSSMAKPQFYYHHLSPLHIVPPFLGGYLGLCCSQGPTPHPTMSIQPRDEMDLPSAFHFPRAHA